MRLEILEKLLSLKHNESGKKKPGTDIQIWNHHKLEKS